jgi:soluble lytic murein transglycosylase-like protein
MLNCRCMQRVFSPEFAARSGVALALLFMAVAFSSTGVLAEPAASPVSFNTRFAAVESEDGKTIVPPNANADAKSSPEPSANEPPKALSQARNAADPRAGYRALIEKEVAGTGLAPEIAEAVMAVESGYNPGAIGGVGEIGLMQILPSTARMLGFLGSNAELAVPATNVRYGVRYLAQAWRLAGGDLCTAVMKYRAGHGESRFSYLSVNYCLAVRGKLAARGFRVTGAVPVATFGEPGRAGGGCGRKCLGGGRIGTVNLAALNTKLGALVMQMRATR